MRTTLTLDEDLAAKLKEEMRRSGESFKRTVNRILRQGFEAPGPDQLARPFRIQPRDLGLKPGIELDNVAELLEDLEGPAHR